ncbi:MAG: hypothetical protein LKE67_02565 [Lactobacillus amylovorus]|nr:hypothetical protein [Lactobacillus amylovorus]
MFMICHLSSEVYLMAAIWLILGNSYLLRLWLSSQSTRT